MIACHIKTQSAGATGLIVAVVPSCCYSNIAFGSVLSLWQTALDRCTPTFTMNAKYQNSTEAYIEATCTSGPRVGLAVANSKRLCKPQPGYLQRYSCSSPARLDMGSFDWLQQRFVAAAAQPYIMVTAVDLVCGTCMLLYDLGHPSGA